MSSPKTARHKGESAFEDRRETPRAIIGLAIEVIGQDEHGKAFCDRTVTIDVTRGGCKFHFTRPLQRGTSVSIRRVDPDGSLASDAILFEVWSGSGEWGWVIGAAQRQIENVWPLHFPETGSKRRRVNLKQGRTQSQNGAADIPVDDKILI